MSAALGLPSGPRLPRAAQAAAWGLQYPRFTAAAHRRFGPTFTVRVGTYPPVVLTTDRDAARRLLTGDPLVKRHGNDPLRPLIGPRSVLLLEPAEHLARRKLLLPPFHGERIRAYARTMEELVDAEIDTWRDGETVSVLPIAQDLTLEVILRAVVGVAEAETRVELRRLIDRLVSYPLGAGRGRARMRLPEWAATLAALPTPAVLTYVAGFKTRSAWNLATRPWWTLFDRLLALLDAQIAATRSDPGLAQRPDILAMLVAARDEEGEALSDADLRDELFALIGAGHETTASAIAWGALLLAHHPDVQARAARAAREEDGPYLDGLVKEVLRLRSPLPMAASRRLAEPFRVGRHTLPAGTGVAIDGWGIHHDPALHPEPHAFRPERFAGRAPEPYTWLPFGGGAHRCIGSGLAELEIRTALTAILRHAELVPAAARMEFPFCRAVTLVPAHGGRVRVRRRR